MFYLETVTLQLDQGRHEQAEQMLFVSKLCNKSIELNGRNRITHGNEGCTKEWETNQLL